MLNPSVTVYTCINISGLSGRAQKMYDIYPSQQQVHNYAELSHHLLCVTRYTLMHLPLHLVSNKPVTVCSTESLFLPGLLVRNQQQKGRKLNGQTPLHGLLIQSMEQPTLSTAFLRRVSVSASPLTNRLKKCKL